LVARINTVAFQGIEVLGIDVQVQMSGGIVAFTVVGLPGGEMARHVALGECRPIYATSRAPKLPNAR